MDPLLFLNIGWMSKYQGLASDIITGGGGYVATHGYGHEIFNFKPHNSRMYGFGRTPHNAIKLENLGAPKKATSIDHVLVIWVAKSKIVGWYKNATVFRHLRPPPPNSQRTYKGDPIGYIVSASAKDCKLLDRDARLFAIPRARQRKHAMGRYLWYAGGPENRKFREQVQRYIEDGAIPRLSSSSRKTGHAYQPDPYTRQRIEKAAIEATSIHFKTIEYDVKSVETDNVGWDLEARHRETGSVLRLEVKGLSCRAVNVELTPREYIMFRRHKQDYRLCILTDALNRKKRRLSVFAYSPVTRLWQDENERPIRIRELKSARLQAD